MSREQSTAGDTSVQYADYALWQQQLLGDETTQESLISTQLDFWKKELKGLPDQLELPTDYQRPMETSYRGETIHFHIDAGMHSRLVEPRTEKRS